MRNRTVSKFGKQALSLLLVVMMLTAQFAGVLSVYAEETPPEDGTTIGDGDTGVSGSGTGAGGGDEGEGSDTGDGTPSGGGSTGGANTHTVTFDYNDGGATTATTQPVVDGGKVEKPASAPSRTGYTFGYWYLVSADGEKEADKNTEYKFAEEADGVTADITLKAKWTQDEYTVTFMNGVTQVVQKTGKHYGDKVTAPTVDAEDGYNFVGWSDGATTYKADTDITVEKTATFNAVWTVNVTLDYGYELENGGTTKTVQIKKGANFNDGEWANPTRNGYDFKGWKLNGERYTDTSVTAPITLTANWKAATYAVTLNTNVKDSNEATLTGENTGITGYTFSMEDSVTLPGAERSNYTFEGWLDSKGNKVTEIAKGTYGNQTYTAQWTGKEITVTLDYGYKANSDDSENVKKTDTAEYGKAYAKPEDPERDGYTFGEKWLGSDNSEYNFENVVTQDFTLKATWTLDVESNYTITAGTAGGEPLANNGWTNKTDVVITPNIGLQISVKTGETEWTGYADSYSVPVEEEGGYTVTFKLKDSTGLESAVGTVSFHYDKTPVDVSFAVAKDNGKETRITGSDATGWRSSQGFIVTVSADAGENGSPLVDNWQSTVKAILIDESIENDSGIEVKIDNAGQVFLAPKQGTEGQLESGHKYVLKISGTMDEAGNGVTNGEAVSATLEYDGSQPVVTVSAESDYTNESRKNFFKGSYAVDINVTEKDLTGAENGAIPEEVTITLDNGEVTAVTGGSYNSVTQVWSAKLTVSGDNAEHTVAVKVDDGVHTKDNFYTATIDSVAPLFDTETDKVNKAVVAAGAAHEQEFAVKYTDNLSGVGGIFYSITPDEDPDYVVENLTITVKDSEDNILNNGDTLEITTKKNKAFKGTISFYATDNVGNKSKETTYTLNIDNLAPAIVIENPEEVSGDVDTGDEGVQTLYTNKDGIFTIKVTDDNLTEVNAEGSEKIIVKVESSTDGKKWDTAADGSWTLNEGGWKLVDGVWERTVKINVKEDSSTDAQYRVLVEATDDVENEAEETSNTLVIDTTKPDIVFVDYKGHELSGIYYANVNGGVQENDTYSQYVFPAGTINELGVTVRVTDTNIDLGSTTGTSKGVIYTCHYETLAAAMNDVVAEDVYNQHASETWVQDQSGAWTNSVTFLGAENNEEREGYYVVYVGVIDKADNRDAKKADKVLANDCTAPTVTADAPASVTTGLYGGKTVHYLTTDASGEEDNTENLATFTVKDWDSLDSENPNKTYNPLVIADENPSVSLKYYENDGELGETSEPSGTWENNEDGSISFDVNLGGITVDGIYTVEIIVTDLAGNQTTYESDYYVIDNTPPEATIRSTSDSSTFTAETWESDIQKLTDESGQKRYETIFKTLWSNIKEAFGFTNRYTSKTIETTMTWSDGSASFLNDYQGPVSVLYGIYEYPSNGTGVPYNTVEKVLQGFGWDGDKIDEKYNALLNDKKEGNGRYSNVITTEVDNKFVIYMRVEDLVGNVLYISSDGMIVEDKAPVGTEDTSAPSIQVKGGSQSVYAGSVGLNVLVNERPIGIYSGLKDVTYVVEDNNKQTVNSTATEMLKSGNAAQSPAGVTFTKSAEGLIGSGTQDVTLSLANGLESDNVSIKVTAKDNADNESSYTLEKLNIDNRTPTATISYDNNTAYNNKYFNQPRTASIVVTELNFDTSNTTVTTQGSVSGWDVKANGNTGTNTATVSYTADGDYTLAFQTTDKAGHTLEDGGVVYEGVATQDFTIDMTNPKVEISFRDAEGNTIPSGGYAKSAVTATITVTEHNFDESSATRGLTVTRDGASHPVSLSWSNNGDTHTATLTFDEVEGAEYAFNMSFVDLANNQCDPFTEVGFFVDTKAPTVEVEGIKLDSANKDIADGQISITITDKYYDADQVTLSLRGAANGAVKDFYTAQPAVLLEDGETWSATYVFNHLDKDDIYTLTIKATDKSGNVSTKMKVLDSSQETEALKFSLNREGSTYDVDETTRALLDGYYTNKLKDDVIITIVNVDELDLDHDGLGIVVVRDLIESLTLVEGEGYVIDSVEEIPGGYRYTVRIFKEVFAEDGAYSILVSTKDMAGNSSRNDTAFDEAHEMELQFYLDTKAPIIKLDNLDDGKTYPRNDQDDSAFRDGKYQAALLTVNDQTLDKVIVTIQYKEGPQSYTWTGEDLVMEGSSFTQELSDKYAIAEGLNIAIQVEALDKAGNVMYLSYSENDDGTIEPTDDYTFTVSTNAFIRFYANKGLFFGTIGGILVLAACVTGLVLSRRKKKETAKA